jgi:ABC-type ATPase involved in cell division
MIPEPPIAFAEVRLPESAGGAAVDFTVPAGRLAVVETGDRATARGLADAALGLIAPAEGVVRAFGRDWSETPFNEAAALRARIGVALAEDGPPPHLPALDAFALRIDWRGGATPEARRADCARAARAFGLPGAPETLDRLSALSPSDRRRLMLAQAFLGAPDLVLIERGSEPMPPDLAAALMNALLRALARDAAALWIADPRDAARVAFPAGTLRVVAEAGRSRAVA